MIFNILFIYQRKLDLSKCYKFELANFKDVLKYYCKPIIVEYINLNFCLNLVKQSNKLNLNRFKNLTHLDILSLELDLENLLDIVKKQNLKSISFSLPNDALIKYFDLLQYNFEPFKNIESITIEFNPISSNLLTSIMNCMINVKKLELYQNNASGLLTFNPNMFKHKFEKLTDLVIGTDNIFFDFDINFFSKLDYFNLIIKASNHLMLFNDLNRLNFLKDKTDHCKFRYHITSANESMERISYCDNKVILYNIDNHIQNYFDTKLESNFIKKIINIELNSNKLSCMLTSLPFYVNILKNLVKLDLRSIHIHSNLSICKLLGDNSKSFLLIYLFK
jgi:hypothetical protein